MSEMFLIAGEDPESASAGGELVVGDEEGDLLEGALAAARVPSEITGEEGGPFAVVRGARLAAFIRVLRKLLEDPRGVGEDVEKSPVASHYDNILSHGIDREGVPILAKRFEPEVRAWLEFASKAHARKETLFVMVSF